MSLGLFVGTAFAVGVTDMFLQAGLGAGVPIFTVDPAGSRVPYGGITVLQAKAEELLPAVCGELGITLSLRNR